jgi:protein-S-isoprenylcysteine O-methyltransferase Ste14
MLGQDTTQTYIALGLVSVIPLTHLIHVIYNVWLGWRSYGEACGWRGLTGACFGSGDATVQENRESLASRIRIVVASVLLGLAITLNIIFWSDWVQIHFGPNGPNAAFVVFSWIGLVLLLLIVIAFVVVHVTLGRNWSGQVVVKRDPELVTTGIYAFARHPMYAVLLWLPLSWFLATGGWLVALAELFLVLCVASRAPAEERLLIEIFGYHYFQYMSRVGPFWRCNLELWKHDTSEIGASDDILNTDNLGNDDDPFFRDDQH